MDMLNTFIRHFEISPTSLMVLGVGLGTLLTIYGIMGAFAGPDQVARRMSRTPRGRGAGAHPEALIRQGAEAPKGLLKALVPSDRTELTRIERQLAQAGVTGPHAVRNYYLMRVTLGFVLPGFVVGALFLLRSDLVRLPAAIAVPLGSLTETQILKILGLLIGAGFFAPVMWLHGQVAARQQKITEAFPNALDLIQISVEAGLGFEAALKRVSTEIAPVAPELSEELMAAYNELRSGRAREQALLDMAARTGVDEVRSFANVVLQSIQFGTSMSSALTAYAREMRITRETRAQEMANKLPVKMSAVMATLMLPALIMLTIGPSVIRFVRFFPH